MNIIIAGSKDADGARVEKAVFQAVQFARRRGAEVFCRQTKGVDAIALSLAPAHGVVVNLCCLNAPVYDESSLLVNQYPFCGGPFAANPLRRWHRMNLSLFSHSELNLIGAFIFFSGRPSPGTTALASTCRQMGVPVVVWGLDQDTLAAELTEGQLGEWVPVKGWDGFFRWVGFPIPAAEPEEGEETAVPAHRKLTDDQRRAIFA